MTIKNKKHMKLLSLGKDLIGFMLCFLLLLGTSMQTHASINSKINYQGKLRLPSGAVVPDASYDIVFKIYDAPSGGTLLWTGNYTTANGNPVTTTDGLFSLLLGSGTGNTLTLDFTNGTYYLGMTVDADAEMTPRKEIGSVPQAINANNVVGSGLIDIAGSINGLSVSSGTIISGTWNGTAIAAPNGGTGQTVYAVGDMLYASSTSALSKLTVGTNGQCLSSNGTTPTWGSCGTVIAADMLDFTDFSDAMTLDASTDIAVTGSNVFSVTNTGSGNSFVVNDQSSDTTPFVIDAAGNVGIGDASPASLFTVGAGDALQINGSGVVTSGTWNGSTIGVAYGGTNATAIGVAGTIAYSNGTSYAFSAAGTAGQCLQSGGAGVPTWGSCGGGGGMSIGSAVTSGTNGSILFVDSGNLAQDNTNFFWDNTNNRLGLGTTTPSSPLDIFGTSNALRLSYDSSNYATLSTSSTGELSLSSSSTTESAIVVGNGAAVDASIQFDGLTQDFYSGLDNTDSAFKIGSGLAVGTTPYVTIASTGTFAVTNLVSCGGIQTNASGVMSCTSDERLKNIQAPFTRGLDAIMQITPQIYAWKQNSGLYDNDVPYSGFIAQNIASAIPEASNIGASGYMQINTTTILAAAINAIKEQQSEIEKQNDVLKQLQENAGAQSGESLIVTSGEVVQRSASLDATSQDTFNISIQNQVSALQDQVMAMNGLYSLIAEDNLVIKDVLGNVALGDGSLSAASITTSELSIASPDQESAMIGTVTLYPVAEDKDDDGKDDFTGESMDDKDVKNRDGKSVVVATKALHKEGKIFITTHTKKPIAWSVGEREDGKDFEVLLSDAVDKPMDIDWWIVNKN